MKNLHLLLVLTCLAIACKSSNKKTEDQELKREQGSAKDESSLLVSVYDENGTPSTARADLHFKQKSNSYKTRHYADFNLTDLEYIKRNSLSLIDVSSSGSIKYVDGRSLEDGCYSIKLVRQQSPYYPKNHMIVSLNSGSQVDLDESSLEWMFTGSICVSSGQLTEISNKQVEGGVGSLDEMLLFLENKGFVVVEKEGFGVASALKNLIKRKKYKKFDELEDIPEADTPRATSVEEFSNPVDQNPQIIAQSSPSPGRQAQYIAEVNNDIIRNNKYTDLSTKFKRTRGTDREAGSTNQVLFGRMEGVEGEFVLRTTQRQNLSEAAKKKAASERIILYSVNQLNLPYAATGRTMVPQTIAVNSTGTASISQKLHPLVPHHMQDKFFNLDNLRSQNKSMAETIEFLHTPKRIVAEYNSRRTGETRKRILWISIAHRDIKLENFLQQSKDDYRAAITDFDLSHRAAAYTNKERLVSRMDEPHQFRRKGTLMTMDPNIYFLRDGERISHQALLASDVWSLGVTMLENTFGSTMFEKILRIVDDTPDIDIQNLYKEGGFTERVRSYFAKDQSDLKIMQENLDLDLTPNQIQQMRRFVQSEDFKIIESMLNPRWSDRPKIAEVVERFDKINPN